MLVSFEEFVFIGDFLDFIFVELDFFLDLGFVCFEFINDILLSLNVLKKFLYFFVIKRNFEVDGLFVLFAVSHHLERFGLFSFKVGDLFAHLKNLWGFGVLSFFEFETEFLSLSDFRVELDLKIWVEWFGFGKFRVGLFELLFETDLFHFKGVYLRLKLELLHRMLSFFGRILFPVLIVWHLINNGHFEEMARAFAVPQVSF